MRKWVTPDRFQHLQDLFPRYGNKCLLGHHNCPDKTHYIEAVPIAMRYAVVRNVPCVDKYGNTQRDENGEIVYTQAYGVALVKGKDRVFQYRPNTLYEQRVNEVVRDWVKDDCEARAYLQKLEARGLHSFTSESGGLRGTFNAISRTIYCDSQPMFQILGLGVNALTFKPFAKVRVAGSMVALHIDISDALKPLSKCKRRKVVRYGKPMPPEMMALISEESSKAVRHYLA
jgi:hypothetical protein